VRAAESVTDSARWGFRRFALGYNRPGLKRYANLARPFTLLPPLLGIISGAICAWGSAHNPDPSRTLTASVILTVVLGSVCAAFLNAANNSLNQIYDLEIDRINKPKRPLVTGEISIRGAWVFTWIMYALGLIPTWLVVVYPFTNWDQKFHAPITAHECFFIYFVAFVSTFVYSVPALGRTKAHPFGANLTIAIPRGCLLKVAGWTMVARATVAEPWFIGSVFMLFLLGAASTKDFSDIEGDRAGGCRTLPIVFGVRRAAWMIAPFFVFPWLLMPIGAYYGVLTGNHTLLTVFGFTLAAWGAYTVYLIVRNPDELTSTENHPSWRHMYLMMMFAQVAFAVAYLI
jgi:4-hydroxybenzoate polyprenyltransferase